VSEELIISFRIQPGAPRNEVTGCTDEGWRIRITAPPVEGKANRKLIEYLSEIFDIPRSNITIIRGVAGKNKMVALTGLTRGEAEFRLAARRKKETRFP
jgi:uncharacterized protein